jgi:hypothetical protein
MSKQAKQANGKKSVVKNTIGNMLLEQDDRVVVVGNRFLVKRPIPSQTNFYDQHDAKGKQVDQDESPQPDDIIDVTEAGLFQTHYITVLNRYKLKITRSLLKTYPTVQLLRDHDAALSGSNKSIPGARFDSPVDFKNFLYAVTEMQDDKFRDGGLTRLAISPIFSGMLQIFRMELPPHISGIQLPNQDRRWDDGSSEVSLSLHSPLIITSGLAFRIPSHILSDVSALHRSNQGQASARFSRRH